MLGTHTTYIYWLLFTHLLELGQIVAGLRLFVEIEGGQTAKLLLNFLNLLLTAFVAV